MAAFLMGAVGADSNDWQEEPRVRLKGMKQDCEQPILQAGSD